jgi:crotonobetainyl-CoA:carnitine CoA-transferase CaiB-like acyl-CoA transferase
MSATPGGVHEVDPQRGVHTAEVLRELLDLSDDEIAALTGAGTIA